MTSVAVGGVNHPTVASNRPDVVRLLLQAGVVGLFVGHHV